MNYKKILKCCAIPICFGVITTSANASWEKDGTDWYYKNKGNIVTNNWQGGYYLKSDGKMAKSEWIFDRNYNAWYYLKDTGYYASNMWQGGYYLKSDGKMAKSEWIFDRKYNAWYYLRDTGYYASNMWQGGYYLKSDGKMAKSEWIFDRNYNSWYYLKDNGYYASNMWQGGYYLKSDGKMTKSEWIFDRNYNSWYYLKDNGYYASNMWQGSYYLKSDGKMAKSEWIFDKNYNSWYYFDETGKYQSKAIKLENLLNPELINQFKEKDDILIRYYKGIETVDAVLVKKGIVKSYNLPLKDADLSILDTVIENKKDGKLYDKEIEKILEDNEKIGEAFTFIAGKGDKPVLVRKYYILNTSSPNPKYTKVIHINVSTGEQMTKKEIENFGLLD